VVACSHQGSEARKHEGTACLQVLVVLGGEIKVINWLVSGCLAARDNQVILMVGGKRGRGASGGVLAHLNKVGQWVPMMLCWTLSCLPISNTIGSDEINDRGILLIRSSIFFCRHSDSRAAPLAGFSNLARRGVIMVLRGRTLAPATQLECCCQKTSVCTRRPCSIRSGDNTASETGRMNSSICSRLVDVGQALGWI